MSLANRIAAQRESTSPTPVARRHTRAADPFAEVKRSVHAGLLEVLGPKLYDAHLDQRELETRVRQTLQAVLERAKNRPAYEVGGDDVSVPDMIRYLRTVFENEPGAASARELFERQRSRKAMICLFLAMLELVKLQAIGLTQADAFGEIGLKRLKGFEAAFNGGGALSAIEEGYH